MQLPQFDYSRGPTLYLWCDTDGVARFDITRATTPQRATRVQLSFAQEIVWQIVTTMAGVK